MARFVVVAGFTLAGVFGHVVQHHQQHRVVHVHRQAPAHHNTAPPKPKTPPVQYAVASWYYDTGETASGFHATYGVASRTLAFGTKVMFIYHGRSVEAIVDDRGPFVYGRTFDLNQTLAAALGFAGVDTVGYYIVV